MLQLENKSTLTSLPVIRKASKEPDPEEPTDTDAGASVAQVARDFIQNHYREQLRLKTLCLAIGVSPRTLQRSFRERFNSTISDYIKTVRLDAARRALATARPDGNSVTTIAQQHGFRHLGRFSVQFRERFGESPRDTLAKRTAIAISSTRCCLSKEKVNNRSGTRHE